MKMDIDWLGGIYISIFHFELGGIRLSLVEQTQDLKTPKAGFSISGYNSSSSWGYTWDCSLI